MIRKNFDLFKINHLPPNLRYEFIDINTQAGENKSNSIQNKEEKVGRKRQRRTKNKKENKSNDTNDAYKVNKPLKHNIILKTVTSRKNEVWKKELFERIKQENGYASTDDNFLTIIRPGANNLTLNNNESLDKWTKKINDCITSFIREFRIEQIEYGHIEWNRGQFFGDLKARINEIRNVYLIDYYDSKEKSVISIIGRKVHVHDFLERNLHIKNMTKNFRKDLQMREVAKNNDGFDLSDLEVLLPIAAKGISMIVSNFIKK